MYFVIVSIYYK